jgi:hypothetical protein
MGREEMDLRRELSGEGHGHCHLGAPFAFGEKPLGECLGDLSQADIALNHLDVQ